MSSPAISQPHPTLLAASVVVKEIQSMGIASCNHDDDKKAFSEEVLEKRFGDLDKDQFEAVGEGLDPFGLLDEKSIKHVSKLVVKHSAGNCQEKSALAFDKLAQLGIRPLELMGIYDQDHVLVVAGRITGTPLTPTAWNADTVICDPWAKRAYYVADLEKEMKAIESVTKGETRMTQKFELKREKTW